MNMNELPDGICRLVAGDGRIDLVLRDMETLAATSVRRNSEVYPIEIVEELAGVADYVATPEILEKLAVKATLGTKPRLVVNELTRWTVSGGRTLFIRLDSVSPGTKLRISPKDELGIPLRNRSAHRIEFLAATHRMTGRLHIDVIDQSERILHTYSAQITSVHCGGSSAAQHLQISHVIPPLPGAQAVVLRFDIETLEDEARELSPYLFISELWINGQIEANGPLSLDVTGNSTGRTFGHVDLTDFHGDDPIVLEVNGHQLEIPLPPSRKVSGRRADPFSWEFSAEQSDRYTLYIDNTFVSFLSLDPNAAVIHVPRRFLNNTERRIAIRDWLGLRTLYEDVAVLSSILTPYEVLQREDGRPVPMPLANQSRYRYAALQSALGEGLPIEEAVQLAHAHRILGIGFDALRPDDIKPLAFNAPAEPDVSIIIPAHNKFEITYHCLCALLVARNKATFEVVLVDDGSTDRTTEIEKIVSGIKLVRNTAAQRFIKACNAGVAASSGRYVVLLNNDTEPTVGWLDALIDPFDRFNDVGLTGSKLLYPDGTLQDAGGIVWRSGNPWNYGRNANPSDPRYSYVRDADYLSGAAMMTTREIWDRVGGLSTYLEPMYFEDTDFAFKVRDIGFRTLFAPTSVVYHHEGKTSGTEVTSGMKSFQEVNRPKFKTRWAPAFNAFGPEGVDPDLEKDRGIVGRVLFLDYATPRPDNDAGSYAAIEEMKLVQALGFKCTFMPRNLANLGHYTSDLEAQGIEVITAPFYLSVPEYIEAHGHEFDAIYLTRYFMAADYIDTIRRFAKQAKVILMNADLHFLREIRQAMQSGDPEALENAKKTRAQELAAMARVDVVLSYNEVEHSVIASHMLNEVKVVKCPWVVRVRDDIPGFDEREGMAFLGGFGHPPNRGAVTWFVDNVVPRLAAQGVGGIFHIYGSAMPDEIRDLASDRIATPGFITDTSELYDKHRIFVAPLLAGAGIKGKVLGALAAGIPCVLSPVAAEGVGLRDGYDCLIAREPMDWTKAIESLNSDRELWERLSQNGRQLVREQYSFEVGKEMMREAFRAVGIYYMR